MTSQLVEGVPGRLIPGYAFVEYARHKRRSERRLRKGRRLHRVSAFHVGRHRLVEAEECARLAVETLAGAAPRTTRDLLLAEAYAGLGQVARLQGRYQEAESALRQALTLLPATSEAGQVRVGALAGLGILCKDTGRFDEADELYHRVDAELAQAGERAGVPMANLLHNQAGLAHAQGDFATGETYARQAVTVRSRAVGDAHVTVAADESVLAANLMGQGRYVEAEALYRKVLACFERQSPQSDYEIAVNLHGLAATLAGRGELGEAEPLYRRALEIKVGLLGRDHAEVALVLNNLGVLLREQGRTAEAESCFARCVPVLESTLGPDHPTAALARRNRSANAPRAMAA